MIRLRASHLTRKFVPRHRWQRASFGDESFSRRCVGGDNSAQCARLANVPNERASVDIPYHGNFVTLEIGLRRFAGAPIRGNLREVADNQPFDVRVRGLLIVAIRANISYVRVSEADNLAGVTGVGENFLVAGKAGIKNDLAATAATCARRAAFKYSSVFEREDRAVSVRRLQCVLRRDSSYTSFRFLFRALDGSQNSAILIRV